MSLESPGLLLPLLRLLGEALCAFLWQGTLIGLCAALALWLLGRDAAPRLRHGLLWLALGWSALLPVLHVAVHWEQALALALPNPMPLLLQATGVDWPLWSALFWLAGVACMALRLAAGLLWVRSTLAQSLEVSCHHWQARFEALRLRMGVRSRVQLRLIPAGHSPFTVGWWRPAVIVPAALLTRMPAEYLDALLAHELAHVRRADYLLNLLQRLVETLLFFHPAIWWLSRQIDRERERIADALAAKALGEPRQLARALDALSRFEEPEAQAPSLAPMAYSADLAGRIRQLLAPPAVHPSSLRIVRLGIVVLCAMGIALAGQTLLPLRSQEAQSRMALAQIEDFIDGTGASHVIVTDAASGHRLLERGAQDMVPIASLTKLVTAMVLLDTAPDMQRRLRIEQQDADATQGGASRLAVGSTLALQDMLKLALMSSDNRATHALARSYPGGTPALAEAVTAKLATLGLRHTVLEEPTGVSARNRSTASDIERIVEAAAQYPDILHDSTQAADTIQVDQRTVEFRNSNPLVGREGWSIQLSKTGRSDASGACLVMRVRSHGRDFNLVVLNAPGLPPAAPLV